MSDLPPELVTVILCWLPVKILLRFRCVSKRWRSLIDSPLFMNMHLKLSVQTNSHHGLVLRHSSELKFIDFDSIEDSVELNHPLMCYSSRIKVIGSCNGLLSICNIAEDIAVWNLSTKRYRILPNVPNNPEGRCFGMGLCSICVYGFGYDAINDDYKVLRIVQFFGLTSESFESEVLIYSMVKNEWMRIPDMPFVILQSRRGAFVTRALHWVVASKDEVEKANLVMAFDLGAENFREVVQPDYNDDIFDMGIGVLGGCLCLTANYRTVGIDVWVMKEYGAKESWTKLFSVMQSEEVKSSRYVRPLIYSKNGKEVLLEHDNTALLWFDLEKKTVRNAQFNGIPNSFEAVVCMGSLLPVEPMRKIGKRKQNQEDLRKMDDFLSHGFKLVL